MSPQKYLVSFFLTFNTYKILQGSTNLKNLRNYYNYFQIAKKKKTVILFNFNIFHTLNKNQTYLVQQLIHYILTRSM